MFRRKKRKPSLIKLVLLVIFLLFVGGTIYAYTWYKQATPEEVLESSLVQDVIVKQLKPEQQKLFGLIPDLAGLNKPRTYLFLFQNNTEMRPSGGFVGVYAVATVDRGSFTLHIVEGTELLDRRTPEAWRPAPPPPISKYLGLDRWYFRDANWSPDFERSAQKALELYTGEEGMLADEIDTVIAITPTVVERIMTVTGPMTVDGITFAAEDFTEVLEYEVEYGFADRGISFADRKSIMEPLSQELLSRMSSTAFTKAQTYVSLLTDLIHEKHIVMYSRDEALQQKFVDANLAGRVIPAEHDSFFWVDANLAALKTDHAMERTLNYTITKEGERYLANVEMVYNHTGEFDWRTSRYLSYARLYVPLGSEFASIGGSVIDPANTEETVDMGTDLGHQWFGHYVRIEPGTTETMSFSYYLPENVVEEIRNGLYTLRVQKQAGTHAHKLTLDLDFDTTIAGAQPAEIQEEWYDDVYTVESDLRVDRLFTVIF